MTGNEASDLRALLRAAQDMKEEVTGVRRALVDFYVPRGEINRKIYRVAVSAFFVLLLVVGGGTTLTLTSYSKLRAAQLEGEIEVVEHRIADKRARLDDKEERLCLLRAQRALIESAHGHGPSPSDDPCGFEKTEDLEAQLTHLEALLDHLKSQR